MATRTQILETSMHLFLNKGCKNVTMDEIASENGMSKRTLYEMFGDKSSLLEETLTTLHERKIDAINHFLTNHENILQMLLDSIDNDDEKILDSHHNFMMEIKKYYPELYHKFIVSLHQHQSNKEKPNVQLIKSNLKAASQVLDEYIATSLNKPSKVVENWVDALFLQQIDFKYDIEKIINNIEAKIAEAKEALSVIEETKKIIKNLKNELKRYKTVNENILKILKRISSQYFYLSSDFTKKSEIFDFITISNRIDLDYEMKMMQDFTYESVLNISDKIQQYFDVAEKRINDIDNYAKRIINENFNSKS